MIKTYPNLNVWLVTNKNNQSIFNFHERIKFIGIDFKSRQKNVFQISKTIKEVSNNLHFDGVYDLHDVIRSKILRFILYPKTKIHRVFLKERSLKNKIINNKIELKKLKHSSERYLDCIKKDFEKIKFSDIDKTLESNSVKDKIIGLAPFSAHPTKMWEVKNYTNIFKHFKDYQFILFAFGEKEITTAKKIISDFKNCTVISNDLNLYHQMELINTCKLFITMDSANMHLASLTSTKVISIWGPTHPHLGFGPLFNEKYIVQLTENQLPGRPFSIYGKIKKSKIKSASESMTKIKPEMVIEKMEFALKN